MRRLLVAAAATLALAACSDTGGSTAAPAGSAPAGANAPPSAAAPAFQPSTEAEKKEMVEVGLALAFDDGIHYQCDPANAGAKRNKDITPNPNLVAMVTFADGKVVVTGDDELVAQTFVARNNSDGSVRSWGFGVNLKSADWRHFGVYVHEVLPGTNRWLPYPLPVGAAGSNGQYSFEPEQSKAWPEYVVLATDAETPCAAPRHPLPFDMKAMARPGANVPYPYQHQ